MITITLDEEKAKLLIRFLKIMKREKSLILEERISFEEFFYEVYNQYNHQINNSKRINDRFIDIINEIRNEFGLPVINKENAG